MTVRKHRRHEMKPDLYRRAWFNLVKTILCDVEMVLPEPIHLPRTRRTTKLMIPIIDDPQGHDKLSDQLDAHAKNIHVLLAEGRSESEVMRLTKLSPYWFEKLFKRGLDKGYTAREQSVQYLTPPPEPVLAKPIEEVLKEIGRPTTPTIIAASLARKFDIATSANRIVPVLRFLKRRGRVWHDAHSSEWSYPAPEGCNLTGEP